ncbi:transposase family protein, partial [Planoprotostelium fungivorum]
SNQNYGNQNLLMSRHEQFFGYHHERFHALFGVTQGTALLLSIILSDACDNHIPEPIHVLWMLYFFKAYPRKYAASEFWMVDPKTHQFWVWRCVALLYQALDTIRMENRLVGGLNIPSLAVDGTECPIRRSRDADTQRLFYSGKKKTHTIMYEIAVDVCTGFIHHVWGGYPGSDNDLSMISASGLLEELFEGEKLLGDKIYRHLDQIVTPTAGKWYTLNAAEQTFNSYVSSRREIVEHVFGRMKQFHCLQEKWRHSLPQHLAVFTVIANIINVDKKPSQL